MTEMWLVRHGESVANVAATAAERAGIELITVDQRDADVPLSPTGREQARAFGEWLATNGSGNDPTSVWVSSYDRARETMSIALVEAGIERAVRIDDRLRDRELTNASVTRLVRAASSGPWRLADLAAEEHLEASDVPITEHQGEEDVEVR